MWWVRWATFSLLDLGAVSARSIASSCEQACARLWEDEHEDEDDDDDDDPEREFIPGDEPLPYIRLVANE